MATGPFRNSGEGGRTPDQSSNLELLKSPEASELLILILLEEELRDRLIKILEEKLRSPEISDEIREHLENDLAQLGPNITELELGTMIRIAFKYIQLSETDKADLAQLVVKIADRYEAFASKITIFTHKRVLYESISRIVRSILSVNDDSNDPKPEISSLLNRLKNALLSALDEAACTLLDQAAEAGRQELIGAISSLLEMTKGLQPDEQKTIRQYIKEYLE